MCILSRKKSFIFVLLILDNVLWRLNILQITNMVQAHEVKRVYIYVWCAQNQTHLFYLFITLLKVNPIFWKWKGAGISAMANSNVITFCNIHVW